MRFSGEIESENVGFVRQRRQNQTSSLPLGMYRVAKDASSSLGWVCFATRKTMFRTSIGHVSQHKVWFWRHKILRQSCKALILSEMRKAYENRVFAINFLLIQKKRVVFNVVCRAFLLCQTASVRNGIGGETMGGALGAWEDFACVLLFNPNRSLDFNSC